MNRKHRYKLSADRALLQDRRPRHEVRIEPVDQLVLLDIEDAEAARVLADELEERFDADQN